MNKKVAVVFLLVAALLLLMVGMVNAASQTWQLDGHNKMWKPWSGSAGGGWVTINGGETYIWTSNEAAQYNVPFAAKQWSGQLYFNNPQYYTDYTADIGYSDANGANFISNGVTGGYSSHAGQYSYFQVNADAFTVPTGKYLALKITNNDWDEMSFTCYDDSNSQVSYPEDSPAYPVPELSTIILFSVGLLVLAGYVVLRRKDR